MNSSRGGISIPASVRGAAVLAAALAWLAPGPLSAAEMTVQNDSVVNFSQVSIQAGFADQERAAAWLTSPCAGDIVAVQVLWLSVLGGAADTLGESITISEAGVFPVPGAPLAVLSGPLLTDGFFNEYRFLDEMGTIPIQVPVALDEIFVVDFRFFDSPPLLGPSVVTDIGGCQAGRNGIFAIPPSTWFSACSLGVTGDFAIRAVVDCVESGPIFDDGFESGDTSAWSLVGD